MKNKMLTGQAGKVAFGILFSRILGYIRDMLVANFFGVGVIADIFYAALRISNIFRRLLGEDSFSVAFVPIFNEYLHTKEKEKVQNFLNVIFTTLLLILILISILGILLSPFIVKIVVGGFGSSFEKIQLTVKIVKLIFPSVIFISLSIFLLAVLNTLNSFFIPALAPASLSCSEIFYMLIILPMIISSNENKIIGLAISVIVGGILHFFIQYAWLKKIGWSLKFKLDLSHPGVRKIIFLMIPSIIGLSVDQINILVDNRCASSLEQGSLSALYYSNRLIQMPISVFGIALVTTSLPAMSKAFIEKKITVLKDHLIQSICFIIFMLLPVTISFMIIGLPIIKLLFEHGKFDHSGAIMTNNILFYYSFGLLAFALSKIFANAFYSFQNTKTPVRIAILSMILHIILCIILIRPMGVCGLAFSTSLSSYFNLILLVIKLKKYIGRLEIKEILASFLKSFVASIIMGFVAFNMCKISNNLFISVPIGIFSSFIIFCVVSYILKSKELKMFVKIFYNK